MERQTDRLVLDRVPRVGFYGTLRQAGIQRCPEDMTFPACLRSVLEYLGEKSLGCKYGLGCRGSPDPAAQVTACGYKHLMGVSGNAFSLSWNRDWEMWGGSILRVTEEALAPVHWAMESVGYGCEILGNREADAASLFPRHVSEEEMRQRLLASLQAGKPAIGFGVVGPQPECSIITGYDQGGDILTGWSFFQDNPEFVAGLEFEPSGYYRKRGWFSDTLGIVLVKEKTGAPPLRQVFCRALERSLAVMRQPCVRGEYASGIATFQAWIESLLHDADFPAEDMAGLREKHSVHNDAVGTLAELRSCASPFMLEMLETLPEAADEIGQAAGCLAVMHDLCYRIWECQGENPAVPDWPEDESLRLARQDTRQRVAELLTQLKAREQAAAGYIQAALTLTAERAESREATRWRQHIPPRCVLESVPYIGFDMQRTGGTIEDTPICSAMRSALAFLGEPCSYGFLMGVSGAAFRFAWNAEYLDGGNLSTQHMGDDPTEHIRRAFRAVGWVPRIVGNLSWQQVDGSLPATNALRIPDFLGGSLEYQDEAFFRDWIVEELHFKGYPMLALGVLFPPEGCILAGYDEGGDVLIGWAHAQDWPDVQASDKVSLEPTGHFRKRDWFNDTAGLVGFHYETGKPSMKDTYRSAVEWAVKLARTNRFGRYYSGLASYPAWAGMLREDDAFAAADAAALDWRLMCHNDSLAATWEGRMHAVDFLRSGARLLPHWSAPYEEAARCYAAQVSTYEKIADVLGGFGSGPEKAQKLAQAENRAAIIPLIMKARELDETAIEHLEKTLAE